MKLMHRVRIQNDIGVAGRPALTTQTERPVPARAAIAVQLAADGAGARLEMAAGQRGGPGRNLTALGRIEEDSGAVLVEALMELQPVDAHHPVPALRGVSSPPRFPAVRGPMPALLICVII